MALSTETMLTGHVPSQSVLEGSQKAAPKHVSGVTTATVVEYSSMARERQAPVQECGSYTRQTVQTSSGSHLAAASAVTNLVSARETSIELIAARTRAASDTGAVGDDADTSPWDLEPLGA
jgi:hypothetical protein